MSVYDRVAFNILANAICSFVAGVLVVSITLHFFRVGLSRWKLALLSLPFVKILWDLFRGVPSDSLLWTGLDPLALPPHHQGSITLGTGFSGFGYFPLIEAYFSVETPERKVYSVSFAEFARSWLAHHLAPSVPLVLLGILFGVSGVLILKRLLEWRRFENARALGEAEEGERLATRNLRGTRVRIYLSPVDSGTPFTGGILRPYVCLPKETYDGLTDLEREAVIQHELAHIRSFDLLINLAINFLGDLFWFVPGYRYLSRKIDRLREVLADDVAVAFGASAPHLASALLKMKQITDAPKSVLYSAFVREKSILRQRVQRLVGEEPAAAKPRLGWQRRWFRALVTAWVTGAVCVATVAGNKKIEKLPSWTEQLSEQVRSWISSKLVRAGH